MLTIGSSILNTFNDFVCEIEQNYASISLEIEYYRTRDACTRSFQTLTNKYAMNNSLSRLYDHH